MNDTTQFLAAVLPRHEQAANALHSGDPRPLQEWLATGEPVSVLPGMFAPQVGGEAVAATFMRAAARFTAATPLSIELLAADAVGDLGYTVLIEHSRVSIDGGPLQPNDLRVTHVYRREGEEWRLVHRHGGGGPASGA